MQMNLTIAAPSIGGTFHQMFLKGRARLCSILVEENHRFGLFLVVETLVVQDEIVQNHVFPFRFQFTDPVVVFAQFGGQLVVKCEFSEIL